MSKPDLYVELVGTCFDVCERRGAVRELKGKFGTLAEAEAQAERWRTGEERLPWGKMRGDTKSDGRDRDADDIEEKRRREAHEAATRRGRKGGEKKGSRRPPWEVNALSAVTTAPDGVSDNAVIRRLRTLWTKHPDWPPLPKTDRALQTWAARVRRPSK
jgi:hypothetical protein